MPLVQKELYAAYIGEYKLPYLCFTANAASSTLKLNKTWSPNAVTLETSTDWSSWTTYTFGSTITLSNIWDKVYWRNTSETDTWFSKDTSNYYQFSITWSVAWSGNTNYLLNKNSTNTVSSSCFLWLFRGSAALTSCPELPATTIAAYCYDRMFSSCSNLETLPKLPALSLWVGCYYQMFASCSKIKLSTTQTWEYQTPYRIPTEWTWTLPSWTSPMTQMFNSTWWTRSWMWTPDINTTYYTSNTVV